MNTNTLKYVLLGYDLLVLSECTVSKLHNVLEHMHESFYHESSLPDVEVAAQALPAMSPPRSRLRHPACS